MQRLCTYNIVDKMLSQNKSFVSVIALENMSHFFSTSKCHVLNQIGNVLDSFWPLGGSVGLKNPEMSIQVVYSYSFFPSFLQIILLSFFTFLSFKEMSKKARKITKNQPEKQQKNKGVNSTCMLVLRFQERTVSIQDKGID